MPSRPRGPKTCIRGCRQAGLDVFIVSHKTDYATYDRTRTNLRTAALEWMTARSFFDAGGLGLSRSRVYFESTRAEKIARIAAIACAAFIDDLEEVFLEPSFPPNVHKILYAPGAPQSAASGVTVMRSWSALRDYLLDSRT